MDDTASLPSTCAACRRPGPLVVRQTIVKGSLFWLESFSCICGHAFEAKNVGLPTPAARSALMSAAGQVQVFVDALSTDGKTVKVLAALLSAPAAEVRRALASLPALIWEGTTVEAAFMKKALTTSGAQVRLTSAPWKAPAPRPSSKRPKR
jgi:hypothetical protein